MPSWFWTQFSVNLACSHVTRELTLWGTNSKTLRYLADSCRVYFHSLCSRKVLCVYISSDRQGGGLWHPRSRCPGCVCWISPGSSAHLGPLARKKTQDPVQCDHSLHFPATAASSAAADNFTALGSITKPCFASAPTAPITRRHLSAGH